MLNEADSPKAPVKRARSAKDKERKRELILSTAATLFDQNPDALPTASAIANHAGVAKGTVYLYFKSKEEIFLALLEQHYQNWFNDITAAISTSNPTESDVINAICQYVETQIQFFQLASLTSSVIEQNIDYQILLAFKKNLSAMVTDTGKHLAERLNLKESTTCSQLLIRSYAMLLGLWQLSRPSQKVSDVLDASDLGILQPKFGPEARDALTQLWHGYLGQKTEKGKRRWKISNLFG